MTIRLEARGEAMPARRRSHVPHFVQHTVERGEIARQGLRRPIRDRGADVLELDDERGKGGVREPRDELIDLGEHARAEHGVARRVEEIGDGEPEVLQGVGDRALAGAARGEDASMADCALGTTTCTAICTVSVKGNGPNEAVMSAVSRELSGTVPSGST